MNQAQAKMHDGSAWKEFCDRLAQAGAIILGTNTPKDALSMAEGPR